MSESDNDQPMSLPVSAKASNCVPSARLKACLRGIGQ